MARDSSEVRLELIRRFLELPDDRLADLERMIDALQLGRNEIEKEEIKKEIFQSSVKPEHVHRHGGDFEQVSSFSWRGTAEFS